MMDKINMIAMDRLFEMIRKMVELTGEFGDEIYHPFRIEHVRVVGGLHLRQIIVAGANDIKIDIADAGWMTVEPCECCERHVQFEWRGELGMNAGQLRTFEEFRGRIEEELYETTTV